MAVRGSVEQARDGQKSRVYKWEEQAVRPFGLTPVPFAHAQRLVNYIWSEMGLLYPPTVEKFQPNVVTKLADASRMTIRMPDSVDTWVLIHEIAHSMTSTHDGKSHHHDAHYVGVYMTLCEKFLRMDPLMLQHTATMCDVKFIAGAKPIMAD